VGELQAAVEALRRFRAEAEVPPGKVLEAVFIGEAGSEAGECYAAYAGAIRALAKTVIRCDGQGPEDATVVLVPGGRLEVAAAVERGEEIARLEQHLAKVAAEVERSEKKLGNEQFVARAPAAVVAKEREKLAEYAAARDELAARLAQLQSA